MMRGKTPEGADSCGSSSSSPPAGPPDGHANLTAVETLLTGAPPADLVVLPELVDSELPRREYLERLRGLAARARAAVVGGSHYAPAGARQGQPGSGGLRVRRGAGRVRQVPPVRGRAGRRGRARADRGRLRGG
ncbi:hypothetical protein ACFSTC_23795 [Nonomuraea ferruginea]